MKIEIQSQDFTLTPSLRNFIREQIDKVMGSYSHRIDQMSIRIKSVRQTSGNIDPQCCVEVQLSKQPTVVVIKRSHDAYATIRQSIAKAGRSTLRQLGRQRSSQLRKAGDRRFSDPDTLRSIAA